VSQGSTVTGYTAGEIMTADLREVLPPGENELAVLRKLLATMPEKHKNTAAREGAAQ
jgi:hypothetical protein